jgi:hypothetical protein
MQCHLASASSAAGHCVNPIFNELKWLQPKQALNNANAFQ